jgi:hypothetical protein
MMSRDEVQSDVRRRDRFKCQNCGNRGEQYAHIFPESDGGEYVLENLLFLCGGCHNYWQEPAKAAPEIKARLIELSQKLRDKPKTDSILSSIFAWPAGETLAVTFGGGIRIIGQERILERKDDPSHPYLTLGVDNFGRCHINARFDDVAGNEFMHVVDNALQLHTRDAWDIAFTRRRIRFEHADRKMKLQIRQTDNMDLRITGSLYINGGYYEITDDHILDVNCNNVMRGCQASFNGHGLLLAPGAIIF